jgi:hypothetical protein
MKLLQFPKRALLSATCLLILASTLQLGYAFAEIPSSKPAADFVSLIVESDAAIYSPGTRPRIQISIRNTSATRIGIAACDPWNLTDVVVTDSQGSRVPRSANRVIGNCATGFIGLDPGEQLMLQGHTDDWKGSSHWSDLSKWGYVNLKPGKYTLSLSYMGAVHFNLPSTSTQNATTRGVSYAVGDPKVSLSNTVSFTILGS